MNPDVFSAVEIPDELKRYFRRAMVAFCDEEIEMPAQVRGTGYCYLGWTPSGRWRGTVISDEHSFDSSRDGSVHLSGQVFDGAVEVQFSGVLRQVFLEFTALGQYEFLGYPGCETFERAMAPGALLPPSFYETLRAAEYSDAAELADVLLLAVAEVRPTKAAPDYLHHVVREIEASHGDIRFADLIATIDVSERKARGDFSRIVGLAPKQFAKILQVNHAFGALMSLGKKRLAELAIECGFADQAHMTRTFGEFLGNSPVRFAEDIEPTLRKFVGYSRQLTRDAT